MVRGHRPGWSILALWAMWHVAEARADLWLTGDEGWRSHGVEVEVVGDADGRESVAARATARLPVRLATPVQGFALYARDLATGRIARLPERGFLQPGEVPDTLTLASPVRAAVPAAQVAAAGAPHEVLVAFRAEAPLHRVVGLTTELGADLRWWGRQSRVYRVSVPGGVTPQAAAARFAADPQVRYAEPCHAYGLLGDPVFPAEIDPNGADVKQWPRHEHPADRDIDLPEAWSLTTGSDEVLIVAIDTGIDTTHPDLRDRLWRNDDPPGDADADGDADDDGNGFVDDELGWFFDSLAPGSPDIVDRHGHGTHVAGIAAAGADDDGFDAVVGVNWVSPILPLRLNFTFNTDLEIAEAVHYGVDAAVEGGRACVVNMSFGGADSSLTLSEAMAYADSLGAVLVAAAGNDGGPLLYPAAYAPVLAVGNLERAFHDVTGTGDLTPVLRWRVSSNRDPRLDLAAPGTTIWSALPTYPVTLTSSGSGAGFLTGTSQATAFVSGVASLVLSAARDAGLNLTASDVRRLLRHSAAYGDGITAPYLHDPDRDGDTDTAGSEVDWSGATLPRNPLVGFGALDAYAAIGGLVDPVVRWVAPAADTLSGLVRLTVAVDDEGQPVRRVVFRVDGDSIGVATEAPYEAYWDASAAGPGAHELRAEAYDTFADLAAVHGTAQLTPGLASRPVIVAEQTSTHVFQLPSGWSLVSLPVDPADRGLAALFPDAEAAFGFDGGYVAVSELVPGRGYWIRLAEGGSYAITGTSRPSLQLAVRAGWNLIGAPSATAGVAGLLQEPSGNLISAFGYDRVYSQATQLDPGRGYWVHVGGLGQLSLVP